MEFKSSKVGYDCTNVQLMNWFLLVFVVEPISTNLGTLKHPWVKRIQVFSIEKKQLILIKLIMFFSSLNQCYDIIICVYWFELFTQVRGVAHGPLVNDLNL